MYKLYFCFIPEPSVNRNIDNIHHMKRKLTISAEKAILAKKNTLI